MQSKEIASTKFSYFIISAMVIIIVVLINYAGEFAKKRNVNNIIATCESGIFVVDSFVVDDPTGVGLAKIEINESDYIVFDIKPEQKFFKNTLKKFRCFKFSLKH